MALKFPLFRFTCCCEIDSIEADKQRKSKSFNFDYALHCKHHPEERLMCRVGKCLDCGELHAFHKSGKQKPRCPECSKKHKREYDNAYGKLYLKHGARGRYNKCPKQMVEKKEPGLIKTDLMPNPVIINPKISPCIQGCRLLSENKNNTTCVHACEYRVRYLQTL